MAAEAPAKSRANSILLCSSDENISALVHEAIDDLTHQVDLHSGDSKMQSSGAYASCSTWDLLIAHVGKHDSFALDVCQRIKAEKLYNPIIAIAESADSKVISEWLDHGADDFISMPCDPEEFRARVSVAIRRYQQITQLIIEPNEDSVSQVLSKSPSPETPFEPDASNTLHAGDIQLCPAKREVSVGGVVPRLTRTEYSLLSYLMQRISRPCSSVELLNNVLGYQSENYLPSLHSHVSRLRRKLSDSKSTSIETIWCYGYRLFIK